MADRWTDFGLDHYFIKHRPDGEGSNQTISVITGPEEMEI